MKNISRRVFIKGLAVAGVAAAASTVLAGCNTNMIPGVDDGEGEGDDVPSTSGVLEYTDKDDNDITLKVSAQGMILGNTAFGGVETAAIKLKIENDLGKNLPILAKNPAITTTATASVLSSSEKIKEGEYYILAEAYNDGNKNATAAVVTTAGLAALTGTKKPKNPAAKEMITVDYLQLKNVTAKQSVTLKLTLKKCVEATNSTSGLVSTLAEQTYTFNV